MGLMGYLGVRENLHSEGKSGLLGRTGLRFPEKWRMFLGKYPINSGKDRHLLGKISHALRMKIGTNPPEKRGENLLFCVVLSFFVKMRVSLKSGIGNF